MQPTRQVNPILAALMAQQMQQRTGGMPQTGGAPGAMPPQMPPVAPPQGGGQPQGLLNQGGAGALGGMNSMVNPMMLELLKKKLAARSQGTAGPGQAGDQFSPGGFDVTQFAGAIPNFMQQYGGMQLPPSFSWMPGGE